jgi:hypothetical protein
MRKSVFLVGLTLAALAAGCGDGGGGSDYEIAKGDLSGKIAGEAWTYKSASTDAFLSDEDGYFTTFESEMVEACGFGGGDLTVLTKLPKEVGEYELGLSPNVTLAKGSDNKVATTGLLTIDSIDATTIKGGMYAIFNDDPNFEISGHFTVTICADEMP